MRFRKRLRGLRWMTIAVAAAAIAAPGAQAAALSGDGGVSAGKVELGGGNGVSAQVANAGGNGVSAQVASNGGGNGVSARVEERGGGPSWLSALLAASALAALAATGAALSRRPKQQRATLSI